MNKKYILFYSCISFIVLITILFMVLISKSDYVFESKDVVKEKVVSTEAKKINNNFYWIYDSNKSTNNYLIPYLNIKNNEVAKLNKKLQEADLKKYSSTNYIYSINGDILSILYTKNMNDKQDYEIYNFNLGTNKFMTGAEILNYVNEDINTLNNLIYTSIELYIRNKNYSYDEYIIYDALTISKYQERLAMDGILVYLGSNKELYVIVDIYTDDSETILIPIIDKK